MATKVATVPTYAVPEGYIVVAKADKKDEKSGLTATALDTSSVVANPNPKALLSKRTRDVLAKHGAGAYGNKPVRFLLPSSFNVSTLSGGVCNTTLNADVTQTADWVALSALFDEYRLVGGKLQYMQCIGANVQAVDAYGAVVWDPTDGVSLTSSRQGAEHKFHNLTSSSTMNGAGAAQFTGTTYTNGAFSWLSFKTDHAQNLTVTPSGTVSAAPGMWKHIPAPGSNIAYDGYFKFYLASNTATAGNVCFTGIIWYEVEMRVRR